jgi:hypothetical protein
MSNLKTNKMKTIHFNIQSKGGAGKSMLTYLQALKRENNKDVAFVDLDNSTKTSSKQLKFVAIQKRMIATNIMDNLKRIDREKLFTVIEGFNALPYSEIFIDFGAPESEQFPNLFKMDFTPEEFKEFETEVGARFIFNIVISGGPAYSSCMEYANQVIEALQGEFDVYLYLNEFTFQNSPNLISEVKEYSSKNSKLIKDCFVFGNIAVDRNSGQNILDNVKDGKGFSEYSGFATKTIMRRELQKV